jgi:ABC-type nickel/cobalt efflux system permease component RcnA
MADLEPRNRSALSRRQREQRAYYLVLATGGLAVLAVVLVVLAIVGVTGLGPAVLAAVLAVLCGLALRRVVAR